jgi:hypothetical protein
VQLILVPLSDLSSALREFGLEARPYLMVLVIVLLCEQSESFLGTELSDTGKVLDAEAIQNLGALQFPRTAAQRTLNGVVPCTVLPHV